MLRKLRRLTGVVMWMFMLVGVAGIAACEWEDGEGGDDDATDGVITSPTPRIDSDGDGSLDEDDCDDENAAVYPGKAEGCDGVDEDCDGKVDDIEYAILYTLDADGDGWGAVSSSTYWYLPQCGPPDGYGVPGDCNDTNAGVFPGAEEIRDAQDNDCDGYYDEGTTWGDNDGDGFSSENGGVYTAGDCNDNDMRMAPYSQQSEFCDGKDNDCSGNNNDLKQMSDTDADGDGWSTSGPAPYFVCDFSNGPRGDCDDNDATVHAGSEDIPDGKDNDCDGWIDGYLVVNEVP